MPAKASWPRSVTTGASGSSGLDVDGDAAVLAERHAGRCRRAPGRSSPSAGDRRGSVGMAGRSYSRRANAAASWTDRCGRLPTPVAAPARSSVAQRRDPVQDAMGAGAGCLAGRRFDRGHRNPSSLAGTPSPTPWSLLTSTPPTRPTTGRAAGGGSDTFVAGARRRQIFSPCPTSSHLAPRRARSNWALVTRVGRPPGVARRRRRRRARRRRRRRRRAATPCRSSPRSASWAGWAAGALALAVPGLVTLTAVRAIVPASVVVAAAALAGRRRRQLDVGPGGPGRVAAVLVGGGRHRSDLRPGVGLRRRATASRCGRRYGYLAPTVVSWALWVGGGRHGAAAVGGAAWVLAAVAS